MSRMKLHQSVRLGAYEIYPIYELNFAQLKELSGYTLIESSDNVSPDANKFRYWSLINNDIPSKTDYFPRQATEDGNILPCDTRYNNLIDGRYYMPETTTESFIEVEQSDVQPEDWGVNPNYITLNNITQGFSDSPGGGFGDVNVCIPEPVNIYDTWDSSTTYYEDTKRFLVRKFFLEDGKSFSVSKAGYYNSNRWRGISFGNGTLTSFRSGWNGYDNRYIGYYFTRSDGTVIDKDYRIEYAYGITGIANTADTDWPVWQNGKNITQFFVHYFDETAQTDFYGIAMAQMDNFLETASPIALEVVAFDAQWWGKSIIAGGGGSGQWTTDGPTSYVQGGQGNFSAPSNNHGDRAGDTATSTASTWSGNKNIFDTGYNKYLMSSPDSNAFKQMVDKLVDPDVWQGFDNKYYSPVDSIITCALIPAALAPSGSAITTSEIIKASKLNLSEATVPTFNIWNKSYHVGDVDIRPYIDGFPDFDNTTITINLPYVGVKALDISACMDGAIAVDYIIDYLTSDITAQIWTQDKFGNYQIRYEFKGNCGLNIPLQQIVPRSTAIMQGVGSAITGLGVGLITGGVSAAVGARAAGSAAAAAYQPTAAAALSKTSGLPAGSSLLAGPAAAMAHQVAGIPAQKQAFWGAFAPTAANSVAGGISGITNSAANASQMLTSSNANGGSVSSPVNTRCYITITRPQWSAPGNYGKMFGYPSDIGGTINQSDTEAGDPFTNFLSVRSIRLEGINCLTAERSEIEELMTAGVYTTNE